MSYPEIDLRRRMQIAVQNMYNSVDVESNSVPFFTYRLFERPIRVEHGAFDSPHVVGRFLNSLYRINSTFSIGIDEEFVGRMARLVFASLDRGRALQGGLAWNQPTESQPDGAVAHNQREVLLALLALARLAGSSEAFDRAQELVRDCAVQMRGQGKFPDGMLSSDGWGSSDGLDGLPAQSGRMVRSLLSFYRLGGDVQALELAHAIAYRNLRESFRDDGTLTEAAGRHLHSVTGTITGILDLGLFLGDSFLVSRARQAYEVGIAPYRSSFGWVQEIIGSPHSRGEANNSGDILETCVLLAGKVDRRYWGDAEKILRNHLLASQLTDPELFTASFVETGKHLSAEEQRVMNRAVGGFFFTSPGDYKSHADDRAPINTDLVGGATEGVCDAVDGAIEDDGRELRVNLMISLDSTICQVRSAIPRDPRIDVHLKEPRVLSVRIPWNTDQSHFVALKDGAPVKATAVNNYLYLTPVPAHGDFTIVFKPFETSENFAINSEVFRGSWIGESLTHLRGPIRFFQELYP